MPRAGFSPTVYSPVEEVDLDEIEREVRLHGVGNKNPELTSRLPMKKNFRTPTRKTPRSVAIMPATPRKRPYARRNSPSRRTLKRKVSRRALRR
jgi:hypothetical protein